MIIDKTTLKLMFMFHVENRAKCQFCPWADLLPRIWWIPFVGGVLPDKSQLLASRIFPQAWDADNSPVSMLLSPSSSSGCCYSFRVPFLAAFSIWIRTKRWVIGNTGVENEPRTTTPLKDMGEEEYWNWFDQIGIFMLIKVRKNFKMLYKRFKSGLLKNISLLVPIYLALIQ